jgi:D-3-phosphoglycerate dehydrogenase / 2-oxoglutarate reductase
MNIVVADDYRDRLRSLCRFEQLNAHRLVIHRRPVRDFESQVARLRDAEIIITLHERFAIWRPLIEQLPRLRAVAAIGRSTRYIDIEACRDRGIKLIAGAGRAWEACAEQTLALILASRRNVVHDARTIGENEWPLGLSHRLRGRTLGIFGFGAVGSLVAEGGRGLGMSVLVWSNARSLAVAREAGYSIANSANELFEQSDVLSLHLPFRKDTRHIVRGTQLALMKPSALLVNTSGANIIQPGALIYALRRGRPGFAALDIPYDNPLSGNDQQLLDMSNVLCLPGLTWRESDAFEVAANETIALIDAFSATAASSAAGQRWTSAQAA